MSQACCCESSLAYAYVRSVCSVCRQSAHSIQVRIFPDFSSQVVFGASGASSVRPKHATLQQLCVRQKEYSPEGCKFSQPANQPTSQPARHFNQPNQPGSPGNPDTQPSQTTSQPARHPANPTTILSHPGMQPATQPHSQPANQPTSQPSQPNQPANQSSHPSHPAGQPTTLSEWCEGAERRQKRREIRKKG